MDQLTVNEVLENWRGVGREGAWTNARKASPK